MHYSSHLPRAFRNRIARYLGVLVAAALIATLGLPSVAQAQAPAAPKVVTVPSPPMDGGVITGLNVTFGPELMGNIPAQLGWRVEYSEPGETAQMIIVGSGSGAKMLGEDDVLDADDPRIHHGVWEFRVSYWSQAAKDGPNAGKPDQTPKGKIVGMPSAWTSYQHGPPTVAPTGFTAYPAGPDARRLVWDVVKGTSYDTRYTADATDDDEWTDWDEMTSGMVVDDLKPGTEYTFELRALGKTRAGVGDLHGPSASTAVMMPMPTPTLPEIALLLLAMLLLGSGAYLLRGRQSGGLTHA